jgi:hypothetical protein
MRTAALAVLFALSAPTLAGVCHPYYPPAYYQKPVVYQQAVVYQALLPVVFVPAASYSVGIPSAAEEVERLRAEVARARQDLDAARAAPPAVAAPPDALPAVVKSDCLRCHAGKEPKGGVSLEGDWPPDLSRRVLRQVMSGTMPPGRPLSDQRRAVFADKLLAAPAHEPKENHP